MTRFAREASAALFLLLGCAGGGEAARRDLDALKAEVGALRRESEALARKVEGLSVRLDVVSARAARAPEREEKATAGAPLVPPDLAVVRVEPKAAPVVELRDPAPSRSPRTPPPVPTSIPIVEPDADRIERIGRRSGREIAVDADEELKRARREEVAARAHALEDFVARYPRHPSADNALVEAAAAYAEAGRGDAACSLAARATEDYPAGDAMSEAIERLAWCESRRGAADAERRLLERIVQEFPRTPAAERAGTRLANISGRVGEPTPEGPARSGQ